MTTNDPESDLSPMLSQPADNAPMISGRGTKIIADARGAYLAGNLNALLRKMNPDQELHFRLAVTHQYLLAWHRILRSIYGDSESIVHIMSLIDQWAAQPTKEKTTDLVEDLYRVTRPPLWNQPRLRETYRLWLGLGGSMLAGSSLLAASQRSALEYAYLVTDDFELNESDRRKAMKEARSKMLRWQLEAAWAILLGKELPAMEMQ